VPALAGQNPPEGGTMNNGLPGYFSHHLRSKATPGCGIPLGGTESDQFTGFARMLQPLRPDGISARDNCRRGDFQPPSGCGMLPASPVLVGSDRPQGMPQPDITAPSDDTI